MQSCANVIHSGTNQGFRPAILTEHRQLAFSESERFSYFDGMAFADTQCLSIIFAKWSRGPLNRKA
jgi:hypothetical protein